jgi:hypothetical protein
MARDLLFRGVSNSLFHAWFPTQHNYELIIAHFRATCLALRWRTYIFTGGFWRKELRHRVLPASKLSWRFTLSIAPVSGFRLSYWLRRNLNLYFLPLAFEGTPANITLTV